VSTPDPWDQYQAAAEKLVPRDQNVISAFVLPRDEALKFGYTPWNAVRRQDSFA
jgi:hypothetical protein